MCTYFRVNCKSSQGCNVQISGKFPIRGTPRNSCPIRSPAKPLNQESKALLVFFVFVVCREALLMRSACDCVPKKKATAKRLGWVAI